MTSDITDGAIIVLTLLALVAMAVATCLSALETALIRLSKAAVQDLIDDEQRGAEQLMEVMEHRDRAIHAIRGTRVLFQAVTSVGVTVVLTGLLKSWVMVVVLAVVIVGILHVSCIAVLGARLGSRHTERVALWGRGVAQRLITLSHVFDPLNSIIRSRRPDTYEPDARAEIVADLTEIIDEVGQSDSIEDTERDMLRNVFELGTTLVREVMVPRPDMVTIQSDLPMRKALTLFVRSGFSRIPVIGDNSDDIRGILYFKDVVARVQQGASQDDTFVYQMMRPAEYTVEMRPAADLLRHMQQERVHMAMVVDEYGGISGLVTLEDIIEEVFGELTDEHDHGIIEPEEVEPGIWKVSSRMAISDVGALLGIEADDEDVDSIGGLLTKATGRVPLPGSEGNLAGIHMVADEAAGRRRQVSTILCSLTPVTDDASSDDSSSHEADHASVGVSVEGGDALSLELATTTAGTSAAGGASSWDTASSPESDNTEPVTPAEHRGENPVH